MAGGEGEATVLEKKRAVKEERLQSHYETYLHDASVRRSQSAAVTDPCESVDRFLGLFSQRREKVEEGLALIRTRAGASITDGERASVRGKLEGLLMDIGDMEKLVADSSFYLPTYTIQSAQATISKLKEEEETAMVQYLPKKKFSFRNKAANIDKDVEKKKETPLITPKLNVDNKSSTCLHTSVSERDSLSTSFQGIRDQHDCVLVRDAKDLEDREFMLSNLSNCRVYLRGKFRALFVNKLKNCHVYVGPVTGSVLIEEVEGSLLMLASHQIRIHSTKSTDFYLRVRSRPIVEYTSGVRFAPYAFDYLDIGKDLQAANLEEETGLWESVDDFRWLRAVHSPNWSVLPSDQRASIEDGSHVDAKNGVKLLISENNVALQ